MQQKKQKHVFRDAVIRDIFQLVKLNLIFAVCCLSVIGIPAGIYAMTRVNYQLQHGDSIYVVGDFLHHFRESFLRSTLWGLLVVAAALVFGYVFWFYATMQIGSGVIFTALLCVTLLPLLLCYCTGCYLWVLQIMTEQPMIQCLRKAVLLSMVSLKSSGIFLLTGMLVCIVVYFGIPYTMPVLLVFAMAFWNYTCTYYATEAIQRYVLPSGSDGT